MRCLNIKLKFDLKTISCLTWIIKKNRVYHLPNHDVSEVFLMFVQLSVSGTGCVYLIHAHTRAHTRTHAHPRESTYLSLSLSRYVIAMQTFVNRDSFHRHSANIVVCMFRAHIPSDLLQSQLNWSTSPSHILWLVSWPMITR